MQGKSVALLSTFTIVAVLVVVFMRAVERIITFTFVVSYLDLLVVAVAAIMSSCNNAICKKISLLGVFFSDIFSGCHHFHSNICCLQQQQGKVHFRFCHNLHDDVSLNISSSKTFYFSFLSVEAVKSHPNSNIFMADVVWCCLSNKQSKSFSLCFHTTSL